MKKSYLIILFLTLFSLELKAQENNNIELGFNLNQYQSDFGVGIHLISPYFFNSKVAIKAGANLQWLEYFDGAETTWTPYQNFQLGIRSRNEILEDKIYIYGEGGVILILPHDDFSSKSSEIGGYGLFGFEFKPIPDFAYFIEFGGVGTGAIADRLANMPIYSNGFLISVGLRVGF